MASTTYTERFTTRLTPYQRGALDRLAAAAGVSRNEVIRRMLESPEGWAEPLVMEARKRNDGRQ